MRATGSSPSRPSATLAGHEFENHDSGEHPMSAVIQRSHLDWLESEAIFILREVAAECERPVLLFSGGKDSVVLLRLAEKAFRPGGFPFPLMHIDTGHNFAEVIDFRDARAAELGETPIVRSVEDSIKRGSGAAARDRFAQCRAGGDAAGSDRGIRLRRLHRRRPARRGKGARQGTHLRSATSSANGIRRPSGRKSGTCSTPACIAARTCACSRSRTDRAGRVAIHPARRPGAAFDLLRTRARGGAAQGCWCR